MSALHSETFTVPVGRSWLLAVHAIAPAVSVTSEPIVMLHGLGGNRLHFDLSSRYSLARAAAARGYPVYIVELRGAGLSRPMKDTGTSDSWGFLSYLEHDLPAVFAAIRQHAGCDRVFGVGHSMGGMLLLASAVRCDKNFFKGIVAIGTPLLACLPLGLAFGMQQFLDLAMRLADAQHLGGVLPLRRLSGVAGRMFMPLATWVRDGVALNPSNMDEEIVTRFIRESIDNVPFQMLHELATAIRKPSPSSPYAHEFHLEKISAPILLLSGSIDRIVPPASMVALARRLRSSDVRLREMGTKMGDRIDYGHVDLLVGRHAPEDVYPPILDFIAEYV